MLHKIGGLHPASFEELALLRSANEVRLVNRTIGYVQIPKLPTCMNLYKFLYLNGLRHKFAMLFNGLDLIVNMRHTELVFSEQNTELFFYYYQEISHIFLYLPNYNLYSSCYLNL